MRDQAAAASAQTERLEAQVLGLELEIVEAEEAIRSNDARSDKTANGSPL